MPGERRFRGAICAAELRSTKTESRARADAETSL